MENMNVAEKIPVYIRYEHGKTICVCHAGKKKCNESCQRDIVTRDKFNGWQETMRRDRYGR